MNNNDLLELYLRKVIEFCDAYDAFSVISAMVAKDTEIKLHDIYTHISYEEREDYEANEFFNEFAEDNDQSEPFDIEELMEKIDRKIAELEEEELREQQDSKLNQNDIQLDDIFGELNGFSDLINLENQDSISDETKKEELNWTWFLSEPGGGKTTLLKMFSLAYAYKYYIELFGRNEKLFGDDSALEDICKKLGVTEGACPFFISVKDLNEKDHPNISEPEGFNKLIVDAIVWLANGEISDNDAKQLLSMKKQPVYVIDGVEEFSSTSFRTDFLIGLDAFSCGNRCILSSRYREYMDNSETELERDGILLSAKEYVIDGIEYANEDIIGEFARRWYKRLNLVSGKEELDVDKDFLIPLSNNHNVRNLIRTPLQLTSLLMISIYDSSLPSDFARVYGRSIELWLSWNNYAHYNYEDVILQLSQVAYQMTISEKERIVVEYDSFVKYIRQARKELKMYYQQAWLDDDLSIDEFIHFLANTHMIKENIDGYYFINRQYQAYLVAHCIATNSFSRETRKKSRFEYVEEHIREKEDFWDQIIIILAMLDIELRDDIISELFYLSEDEERRASYDASYYVSLLIQLAGMPGANYDDDELEKLFNLIVRDKNKRMISNDLQRILAITGEHGKELLTNMIGKSEELSEKDKEKFMDIITALTSKDDG